MVFRRFRQMKKKKKKKKKKTDKQNIPSINHVQKTIFLNRLFSCLPWESTEPELPKMYFCSGKYILMRRYL